MCIRSLFTGKCLNWSSHWNFTKAKVFQKYHSGTYVSMHAHTDTRTKMSMPATTNDCRNEHIHEIVLRKLMSCFVIKRHIDTFSLSFTRFLDWILIEILYIMNTNIGVVVILAISILTTPYPVQAFPVHYRWGNRKHLFNLYSDQIKIKCQKITIDI